MKISQSLSSVSSLGVHERLKFAKNTVAIFFVVGILLSIQVWVLNRFFPMFPIFEWMGAGTSIFNRLGGSFCKLGIEEGKIIFLEFEQPLHRNKLFKFTCKDVE